MKCPNCKLENPPTEEYCDCGYCFKTRKVDESHKIYDVVSKKQEEQLSSWSRGLWLRNMGTMLNAARIVFGNYNKEAKLKAKPLFITSITIIIAIVLWIIFQAVFSRK